MLEYALAKSKSKLSPPELNMTIECFLLHYRNLIEFFSGAKHRKNGSDISIAKPEVWSGRKFTEQEAKALAIPAQKLVDEYWTVISQFLQHCTIRRFKEFMDWDLQEMWDKLEFASKFFRNVFPPTTRSEGIPIVNSTRSLSTAPFSRTAAPMVSKK
jgi:hypothetical protein